MCSLPTANTIRTRPSSGWNLPLRHRHYAFAGLEPAQSRQAADCVSAFLTHKAREWHAPTLPSRRGAWDVSDWSSRASLELEHGPNAHAGRVRRLAERGIPESA